MPALNDYIGNANLFFFQRFLFEYLSISYQNYMHLIKINLSKKMLDIMQKQVLKFDL